MDERELKARYDRAARWYDLAEFAAERVLGLRRMRRRLAAGARGRVLEVAVGTGKNLRHYPPHVTLVALDLSEGMLARARRRAARHGVRVRFLVGDAARLPFPGGHFDTVVSSLTTCTFPDPVAALREMGRVCGPGGSILLLEHGRSDRGWIGRFQDRRAHKHARTLGCHWNREPHELARSAGLELIGHSRRFLGVLHLIRSRPGPVGTA